MGERIPPGTSTEYGSTVGSLRVARLEQVAHRFGSDKLYICLSNKCFKVYPVYSLCTDVRPSQDYRILHMQTVQINLAPSSLSESGTAALSLERSTTLYYTLIISPFVKFFIITFNISL